MKKYQIIYANPPWDYGSGSFPSVSNANAYPLMKTADICALPVREIVHPDALLFLWTTMTHIPDALQVIEAWGFRYITNGVTWVKTNAKSGTLFFGMGYWTRQNAELCLLAKRGAPFRRNNKTSSLILSPRRLHSQKPDQMRATSCASMAVLRELNCLPAPKRRAGTSGGMSLPTILS